MHQVSYNEVTIAVDLFHTFSSHKTLQEPTRSPKKKTVYNASSRSPQNISNERVLQITWKNQFIGFF
jgi:hypothetical protein